MGFRWGLRSLPAWLGVLWPKEGKAGGGGRRGSRRREGEERKALPEAAQWAVGVIRAVEAGGGR